MPTTSFNNNVELKKTLDVTLGSTMHQALNMSSKNINNVLDPVAPQDAATKAYVDNVEQVHRSAVATSTVNVALTGVAAAANFDNVTVVHGDVVLLRYQTNAFENGLWTVNTAAAWTRESTYQTGDSVFHKNVTLSKGDIFKGTTFIQTEDVVVGGTSPTNDQAWQQSTLKRSNIAQVSKIRTFNFAAAPGDNSLLDLVTVALTAASSSFYMRVKGVAFSDESGGQTSILDLLCHCSSDVSGDIAMFNIDSSTKGDYWTEVTTVGGPFKVQLDNTGGFNITAHVSVEAFSHNGSLPTVTVGALSSEV